MFIARLASRPPRACFSLHSQCMRQASSLKRPWTVSEEVQEAVQLGKPVVALETTIYTHGFPYPSNIALSSELESLVRFHGGIPATIGILNGVAKVGMQAEEIIELLEKTGSPDVAKVSRRDLGFLCSSSKYNGGTTIAGTMVLAHLAGIKVFATGGLGGVHRDRPGETSMDISADLTELGRTPIALISSGCKSFLDTPRTLEFLETQGVGVATFADGRSGPVDLPAFWTRDSGIRSPNVVQDEKHAASVFFAQLNFPLSSGLLFANPIPEKNSLSRSKMDPITEQAIEEASKKGFKGNSNTPYILSRIRELSGGSTVEANKALVEANVVRGTKVAVELAKLDAASRPSTTSFLPSQPSILVHSRDKVDIVVAGSVAIDLNCHYSPLVSSQRTVSMHTSNPSRIHEALGGVACNIARASHLAGANALLCSVVGNDHAAVSVRAALEALGMETEGLLQGNEESRTARYIAINDANKELVVAMADMGIVEDQHGSFESNWASLLANTQPNWLVVDANWSSETLHSWIDAGRKAGARIAFEPVSVEKSTRLLANDWKLHLDQVMARDLGATTDDSSGICSRVVDLATPNELEVLAMSRTLTPVNVWSSFLNSLPQPELESLIKPILREGGIAGALEVAKASLKLLGRIPCILTKLGPKGVLQTELLDHDDVRLQDPATRDNIIFCSSTIAASLGVDRSKVIPSLSSQSPLQGIGAIYMKHHSGLSLPAGASIQNVNGVGDTFLGVLMAVLCSKDGMNIEDAIATAQEGAILTLQSKEGVSPKLKALLTPTN